MSTAVLIGASTLAFTPLASAQEDGADEVRIEEITVTGSRIKRAGVDTVYPGISVGVEELEDGAFTNIADALNQIPSFGTPDATPFGAQNQFSTGQNFVDFLGLRYSAIRKVLLRIASCCTRATQSLSRPIHPPKSFTYVTSWRIIAGMVDVANRPPASWCRN